MSGRTWGLLCPEGHGLLVEREEWSQRGVAWCPHQEHDLVDKTSGRMYRRQEVEEGWFDPSKPIQKSPAQIEREAAISARAEAQAQARMEARRMAEAPKVKKERAPRVAKEPQECGCGCGGMTKGGRFLPGHDARFHAAEKKAAAEAAAASAAE